MATHGLSEQLPLRGHQVLPLIVRVRFQIWGALIAPSLAWLVCAAPDGLLVSPASTNTFIATVVASLFGYFLMRKVALLPGGRPIAYVFPMFAIAFMIALSLFLFLRLDYARVQLFMGFSLCVLWFGVVIGVARRVDNRSLAVIPVGDTATLAALPGRQWQVLSAPALPRVPVVGVVADLRADHPQHWELFITDCVSSGTPVFHVKQVREMLTGRVEIAHLSENTLGSLIPDDSYMKIKRIVDGAFAALFLIAGLVPLLIIGALIRFDSPGPALFRQKRVGRYGRPFVMYKFRTMVDTPQPKSEDHAREAAQTRTDDKRITRLGHFLRRTRLDELPQAYNILMGEMSWIGPRPEAEPLANWYQQELPFYRYRHIVAPGITGWAQVNQGHVTAIDEVLEKLHYDFFYIKNFSAWLDILITLKTFGIVFSGFGAR